MSTFELVILVAIVILFFIARRWEKESIYLKNIQLTLGVFGAIIAAHFTYGKLIKEKEEYEKLAAVLNLGCQLEKVAETDSCYYVKANLSFENKSQRRINILFATFSITGFDICKGTAGDAQPQLVQGDARYSRDFDYKWGKILHSQKLVSKCWIDYNQFSQFSYVIAVPKTYSLLSLGMDVAINNYKKDFPAEYLFTDSIQASGRFRFNVNHISNNDTIDITDSLYSDAYQQLVKEYGFMYTFSEFQLLLK